MKCQSSLAKVRLTDTSWCKGEEGFAVWIDDDVKYISVNPYLIERGNQTQVFNVTLLWLSQTRKICVYLPKDHWHVGGNPLPSETYK